MREQDAALLASVATARRFLDHVTDRFLFPFPSQWFRTPAG